MTAIELYKFVTKNDLSYTWINIKDQDVILFVTISNLEELNKLLGPKILDEDGIECRMKDGYFCFEMADICDYFGIDITDVFKEANG